MDKLAAVIEAAGTRLRPILMTTAATVVGHFPLVLATGPGAGARNSIGIMLVSGMIIGTLFTLFVVPSIYMLVARRHAPAPAEIDARETRSELKEIRMTLGYLSRSVARILVGAAIDSVARRLGADPDAGAADRGTPDRPPGRRSSSRSTTRSGAPSRRIRISRSSSSERTSKRNR